MKIYVLVENELLLTEDGGEIFTDVVGVFTSRKKLAKATKNLHETETMFYEMKEMKIDELMLPKCAFDDEIRISMGNETLVPVKRKKNHG